MNSIPGVASKLALRVPGFGGTAGLEPTVDSWDMDLDLETPDLLFLCRAFWMDAMSDGRLAKWWKTLRFRMMAYTRLKLPAERGGIWLTDDSAKTCWADLRWETSHHQTDTEWCCWRPPAERRPGDGSGVRRRGTRVWWRPPAGGAICWPPPWTDSSDTVRLWQMKSSNHNKGLRGAAVLLFDPHKGTFHLLYSLFTMTVSRQSNRGWRCWCPLVMTLWKILTHKENSVFY